MPARCAYPVQQANHRKLNSNPANRSIIVNASTKHLLTIPTASSAQTMAEDTGMPALADEAIGLQDTDVYVTLTYGLYLTSFVAEYAMKQKIM